MAAVEKKQLDITMRNSKNVILKTFAKIEHLKAIEALRSALLCLISSPSATILAASEKEGTRKSGREARCNSPNVPPIHREAWAQAGNG